MAFSPCLPLSIRRTSGGYSIIDAVGCTLLYVYCRREPYEARIARILTYADGEDLARQLARFLTDSAASQQTPETKKAAATPVIGSGGR